MPPRTDPLYLGIAEQETDRPVLKKINHYVRGHPFIRQFLIGHTTTQRRKFEREIYDYARGLGLNKKQSRSEVTRARSFCGELEYDSDDSRLEGEFDDTTKAVNTTTSKFPMPPSNAPTADPWIEEDTLTTPKEKVIAIVGKRGPEIIENETMSIPKDKVLAIIGRHGSNIMTILEISGSSIIVGGLAKNNKDCIITISGTKECNEVAVDILVRATQLLDKGRLEARKLIRYAMQRKVERTGSKLSPSAEIASVEPTESIQIAKSSKKSKKRKAEDVIPEPDVSYLDLRTADSELKEDAAGKKQSVHGSTSRKRKSDPSTKAQGSKNGGAKKPREQEVSDGPSKADAVQTNDEASPIEGLLKKKRKTKRHHIAKEVTLSNLIDVGHSSAIKPDVFLAAEALVSSYGKEEHDRHVTDTGIHIDSRAFLEHSKKAHTHEQGSSVIDSNYRAVAKQTETTTSGRSKLKKKKSRTKDFMPESVEPLEKSLHRMSKEPELGEMKSVENTQSKSIHKEKLDRETTNGVSGSGISRVPGQQALAKAEQSSGIPDSVGSTEEVRSEYFTPTKRVSKSLLPKESTDSNAKFKVAKPLTRKPQSAKYKRERLEYFAEIRASRRESLGSIGPSPTHIAAAKPEPTVEVNAPFVQIEPTVGDGGKKEARLNKKERKRSDKKERKRSAKATNAQDPQQIEQTGVEIHRPDHGYDEHGKSVYMIEPDDELQSYPVAKLSTKYRKRPHSQNSALNMVPKTNEAPGIIVATTGISETMVPHAVSSDEPPYYNQWTPINKVNLEAAENALSGLNSRKAHTKPSPNHGVVDHQEAVDIKSRMVEDAAEISAQRDKAFKKRKKRAKEEDANASTLQISKKKPQDKMNDLDSSSGFPISNDSDSVTAVDEEMSKSVHDIATDDFISLDLENSETAMIRARSLKMDLSYVMEGANVASFTSHPNTTAARSERPLSGLKRSLSRLSSSFSKSGQDEENCEILTNEVAHLPTTVLDKHPSPCTTPAFISFVPTALESFRPSPADESASSFTPEDIFSETSVLTAAYTPSPNRRKATAKASRFFPQAPVEKVSCIPFPALNAASFGLVQECLCHDPFRLLIAVMFLTKTRGKVALPVCYDLFERYPTTLSLAYANFEELSGMIHGLGLHNQRAERMIQLALTWVNHPPEKGQRYRKLHYPTKECGKDIPKGSDPIDDEDPRSAWEIAHLPGTGPYAMDSWRIFCRDELRGLPTGILQELTPESVSVELQQEWTRVLPLDKELRAYLRWRWLRLGWSWNPLTGERKRLDQEAYERIEDGGVAFEGDEHWSLEGAGTATSSFLSTEALEMDQAMSTGSQSLVEENVSIRLEASQHNNVDKNGSEAHDATLGVQDPGKFLGEAGGEMTNNVEAHTLQESGHHGDNFGEQDNTETNTSDEVQAALGWLHSEIARSPEVVSDISVAAGKDGIVNAAANIEKSPSLMDCSQPDFQPTLQTSAALPRLRLSPACPGTVELIDEMTIAQKLKSRLQSLMRGLTVPE